MLALGFRVKNLFSITSLAMVQIPLVWVIHLNVIQVGTAFLLEEPH